MTADIAIRLRRAEFNRALAAADIAVIGTILSPNAILITGTDSGVISGRKAQLLAWKREFSAKPRTIYTRTPDPILSSKVEPIAMEHGQWRGVVEGMAFSVATGTYAAKWREIRGDWQLVAEIFVTLG